MIEMNPFYAHESSVGPVFDVATWSQRKALVMAIICLIGGLAFAGGAAYAWTPSLFIDEPPEALESLKQEHAWGTHMGIGFVAFIGFLGLAGACSSTVNFFSGDYYFRAGAGGISLRVPNGLDLTTFGLTSKVLQLDLSNQEIDNWVIVQHKRTGAMSRDAGNVMAFLKLKTVAGKKYEFSLDHFREPARIISSKIEDARQMVPLGYGEPETSTSAQTVQGTEAAFDVIFTALDRLLWTMDNDACVAVVDPTTNKFVQFAANDGSLLFDLPAQTLDESEMLRAIDYFRQLGHEIEEYQLLDAPDGEQASTQRSFKVALAGDTQTATRLAMDVFKTVYRIPPDAPLVVEEEEA
jgi:hypothetical protein